VTGWVWAARGGGASMGHTINARSPARASLHLSRVRMLPLGGCREIVGGVCGLRRRVSGYR